MLPPQSVKPVGKGQAGQAGSSPVPAAFPLLLRSCKSCELVRLQSGASRYFWWVLQGAVCWLWPCPPHPHSAVPHFPTLPLPVLGQASSFTGRPGLLGPLLHQGAAVPGGSGMQPFHSVRFPDLLGLLVAIRSSVGAPGGRVLPPDPDAAAAARLSLRQAARCGGGRPGAGRGAGGPHRP